MIPFNIFGFTDLQLILILSIFVGGIIASKVVSFLIEKAINTSLQTKITQIDKDAIHRALKPIGLIAGSAVWWLGYKTLKLPTDIENIVFLAIKIVFITGTVLSLYTAIDILSIFISSYARKTSSKLDDLLVPFIRKTLKIVIITFGILFIADNFNLDITSVLAGVGLGGIAVALAAQDTIKNLFGSVTVIVDRPFEVGDWVKIGNIEGIVEELGFRSTRIRTFYDSLVTIPNAKLINSEVDNFGARRYRRWKTVFEISYSTNYQKVNSFCNLIKELIIAHPHTRKESIYVVANDLGAYGIKILVYMFFNAPTWEIELNSRHQLILAIIALAEKMGIEIVYPTYELFLSKKAHKTVPFLEKEEKLLSEIKDKVFTQKNNEPEDDEIR